MVSGKAERHLRDQPVDASVHCPHSPLLKIWRVQLAAAVYQYQADNDGEWGEIAEICDCTLEAIAYIRNHVLEQTDEL